MDHDVRTCRECGCTDDDCRACIARTGVPCHWVEQDLCSACVEPATVRALHEQGLSDQTIAERMASSRSAVQRLRVAMGLPAHRNRSSAQKEVLRRRYRQQIRETGCRSLRELALRVVGPVRAAARGWPQAANEIEARILDMLDQPVTLRFIARRLGLPDFPWPLSTVQRRLAAMRRSGLVVVEKAGRHSRWSRAPGVERRTRATVTHTYRLLLAGGAS